MKTASSSTVKASINANIIDQVNVIQTPRTRTHTHTHTHTHTIDMPYHTCALKQVYNQNKVIYVKKKRNTPCFSFSDEVGVTKKLTMLTSGVKV